MKDSEIYRAWVAIWFGLTKIGAVLVDLCRSQMANYKAPREIVFIDEIPRSAIGKVDKKRLV
jgi:acyl-CoA synthetase (AMP-forming)/AMP-acid ligase II